MQRQIDGAAGKMEALTFLLLSHEEKSILAKKDGGREGIEMSETVFCGLLDLQTDLMNEILDCAEAARTVSLNLRKAVEVAGEAQ